MSNGSLIDEIDELLLEARDEGRRYSSAHYRDEGGGKSGLAIRLEAIEASLRRLASAVDQAIEARGEAK